LVEERPLYKSRTDALVEDNPLVNWMIDAVWTTTVDAAEDNPTDNADSAASALDISEASPLDNSIRELCSDAKTVDIVLAAETALDNAEDKLIKLPISLSAYADNKLLMLLIPDASIWAIVDITPSTYCLFTASSGFTGVFATVIVVCCGNTAICVPSEYDWIDAAVRPR
jgi:hypothetical protein